jgi:hypothetical protein
LHMIHGRLMRLEALNCSETTHNWMAPGDNTREADAKRQIWGLGGAGTILRSSPMSRYHGKINGSVIARVSGSRVSSFEVRCSPGAKSIKTREPLGPRGSAGVEVRNRKPQGSRAFETANKNDVPPKHPMNRFEDCVLFFLTSRHGCNYWNLN